MSLRVVFRPLSEEDIDEQSDYIARDNLAAALRFREAVLDALRLLAEMPGVGSPRRCRNPRLAGLRVWPVPGFPNHLIFYRASGDAVEVIRVLCGSRDVQAILERE